MDPIHDIHLYQVPLEKFKVLLVVSSNPLSGISKRYLENAGPLEITVSGTGSYALELAKKHPFDAILSDYDMSDMNGIDLHRQLQDLGIKIPFLLFTITDRDREILEEGERDGIRDSRTDHDIRAVFHDQSQKIIQAVELFLTRNRLELYSHHLEELVEERTRQLREAQRFAIIGEIATMIGHDMRNPLQVITNLLYLAGRKLEKMPENDFAVVKKHGLEDFCIRIGREVSYLNKIVSDLQDYAREVHISPERIQLLGFIREICISLLFPQNISLTVQVPENLEIPGDPVLLKRVFSNLFTNAIQAMENGGDLTVSAEEEGKNVSIFITDTGSGIASEILEKIFDPLFTTKSKGTGLGLPVVKRLVEAHSGEVMVHDTTSSGTTFMVRLPKENTMLNLG